MGTYTFRKRTPMPVPAAELFEWHTRPGAFERLAPPWGRVTVLRRSGGIRDGGELVMRMGRPPFAVRWKAIHPAYREGAWFRDVQSSGPFARWEHTHRMEPNGETGSILEDDIEYEFPLGAVGGLVGNAAVRHQLERLFEYRHRTTSGDLAMHRRYGGDVPMSFLSAGDGGMPDQQIEAFLTTGGHHVRRLRTKSANGAGNPEPVNGEGALICCTASADDMSAAVIESAVAAALSAPQRPKVMLVLLPSWLRSGGAYDRPETRTRLERAAGRVRDAGIRSVSLRVGMVLSPMIAGVGSLTDLAHCAQRTPGGIIRWTSLEDLLGAVYHILRTDTLEGEIDLLPADGGDAAAFHDAVAAIFRFRRILGGPRRIAARLFDGSSARRYVEREMPLCDRLRESNGPVRFPDPEKAIRHAWGRFR